MANMITLEVEITILAKLPSLTQPAIRKLERAGIRVVSVERSGNRVTVYGTLSVRPAPLNEVTYEVHSVRPADAAKRRCLCPSCVRYDRAMQRVD